MAHSTSNSSSTRRSLRLITAERKSSTIEHDETSTSKREEDPSNEQSSSSNSTHSRKRSHSNHRNASNSVNDRKRPRKRARQSSSSDDDLSHRTRSRSSRGHRRNVCVRSPPPPQSSASTAAAAAAPIPPPLPPPPPPPPATTTSVDLTSAGPSNGALFGRVQHLMNRVGCHSVHGRLQEFLQGIQSSDVDLRQTTLNDLCSFLVMSNEETLPGFQYRLLYPLLRDCLADPDERHSEIVLTACRALTYLMEALPRSIGQVVEATPIFLSKLRRITSIDIAEQTLTALEMISKRNGKDILMSDGISACLEFLDFFSLNSQNKALSIVSNCCLHLMNREDFPLIRRHLDQLIQRLKSDEKKSVEHLCQIFSRLIENFHRDSLILRELARETLLQSLLELLRRSNRNLLHNSTLIRIIHMFYMLTRHCPSIVASLFQLNFVDTFLELLLNRKSSQIDLIPRSSAEYFEMVSFIGEILPRLPVDDPLFSVEQSIDSIRWHWLDDQGQLRPYSFNDSRTIENAWQQHEDDIQMIIDHRNYLIDFQQFQQINEETNQMRLIKRIVTNESSSTSVSTEIDPRFSLHCEHEDFIRKLFPILYEICQTSAGPTVKHRSLQSLLRMIFYSSDELLRELVSEKSISSQIASMLASNESKIVINALQMTEILMKKLPKIFAVEFARQGVVHQLEQLTRQRRNSSSNDWIENQAKQIRENFFSNSSNFSLEILHRLSSAVESLRNDHYRQSLIEIAEIISHQDVSPFEMLHSGLIKKILFFFTDSTNNRDERLKDFLKIFARIPFDDEEMFRQFISNFHREKTILNDLIEKLHGCINQLEQLPIRVNDIGGQTSTLRLISSQQLKCQLVRHPSCKTLRTWTHGPVKIDPLALVSAIEKYLLLRGIATHPQMDDDEHNEIHLDFLLNDHLIPHQMTIYQAINLYSNISNTSSQRFNPNEFDQSSTLWTRVHTIYYRQSTTSKITHVTRSKKRDDRTRKSRRTNQTYLNSILNQTMLNINDISSDVIDLIRILHGLNFHWFDLFHSTIYSRRDFSLIDKSEFYSTKLTAKINRQLQDPLIIMMSEIPSWIVDLAHQCRCLFPFETRQMLFYPCAFDRERAMQRLLDNTDLFHPHDPHDRQTIGPRIERKKVQLSRENIFNEMEKILDNWNSRQFLEVQYENEVGFGLGPTLEAYALISKEFQRTKLDMWRNTRHDDEYVDHRYGLYPSPLGRNAKTNYVNKIRSKYSFLGKFLGKALMDCRMVDLPLNYLFYRWMLNEEEYLQFDDLIYLDRDLYEQMKKFHQIIKFRQNSTTTTTNFDENLLKFDGCSIDDLCLHFVLPGYSEIELKKNGKDLLVTLDNLDEYVQLVVHWTLIEGVRRQIEAFRDGFNSIFPIEHLKYFYADELNQLFCGSASTDRWQISVLLESTRCDHGYTSTSRPVQWLFEILSEFNSDEQRSFLQFLTGTPRLPVGGFRMLNPPLTIVRQTAENSQDNLNPDAFLPSVMTCVNYLKLPDYSSKDILKTKLFTAIRDGQYAFLLS